ncbi:MAG TPA: hypothetical protein VMD30_05190 [Tepidisphaeraceae bacterium]|nr:hypothetical protein [Tepidisphaeraceae bacterium]
MHRQLVNPRAKHRRLSPRLAKIDTENRRTSPAKPRPKKVTPPEIDRWLDELAEGLPPLPPLPADFSRNDVYEDHD